MLGRTRWRNRPPLAIAQVRVFIADRIELWQLCDQPAIAVNNAQL